MSFRSGGRIYQGGSYLQIRLWNANLQAQIMAYEDTNTDRPGDRCPGRFERIKKETQATT